MNKLSPSFVKSLTLVTVLASLSLTSLPALAQFDYRSSPGPYPPRPSPPVSCAKMEVLSQGYVLQPIAFERQWWIEGTANEEYSISITNNCPTRVLAIVSVDGLNVLNGQKANFNQTGYVVSPNSNTVISGWRKSANNTAAFYFTYPLDSYGARMQKAENLGIIGAAFFSEKEEPIAQYEAPRAPMPSAANEGARSKSNSLNADSTAKTEQSLGTGYGRELDSKVRKTEFERASSYPFFTTQVRYESRNNLIRMGAIKDNRYYQPSGPRAFPSQEYVPMPPPRRY